MHYIKRRNLISEYNRSMSFCKKKIVGKMLKISAPQEAQPGKTTFYSAYLLSFHLPLSLPFLDALR